MPLHLPVALLTFVFLIWSVFSPVWASITFCVLVALLDVQLILGQVFARPRPDPTRWSADDVGIIQRYHLYLRYPIGAPIMSRILNITRWSAMFWVPWLLWNRLWIPAFLLVLHFGATSTISVWLDPVFFYRDALQRGDRTPADELEAILAISERLHRASDGEFRREA